MPEVLKVEQPAGINLFKEEVQLNPKIWQDAHNVQFEHGLSFKVDGYEEGLGVASVSPEIIVPLRDDDDEYYWWAYAGYNQGGDPEFWQITSTIDHNNVTPDDVYNPELATGKRYKWTGDSINGVPYITWGIPYFYDSDTGKFKQAENIPRHNGADANGDPVYDPDSPDYKPNTGEARVRFQTIRTYQNFMIGLNWDSDEFDGDFNFGYGPQSADTANQNAIWWSHAVIGKNVDVGWKDAAPNQFSGWNFLGGSGGPIVDGKVMRDSFIIYRESSVWQMTYIGGINVFAFKELFTDTGVLGLNCAAEVDGKHIVVGQSDVYMHDGVQKTTISDGRVRQELFKDIMPEYKSSVFMMSDYKNKEVVIAIPSNDKWVDYTEEEKEKYKGTCDVGYVFNWIENTWSKKDLPHITGAIYTILSAADSDISWEAPEEGGIVKPHPDYPDSPAVSPGAPGVSWEEAVDEWKDSYFKYNPAEWGLAMTSGGDNRIYTAIPDPLHNGNNFRATMEKTYMDMGDRYTTKYVSRLIPLVRKGVVEVYVSSSYGVEEGYNWTYLGIFDPAKDTHISCRENGRYIHVKFEIPEDSRAEIRGWWLEWDYIGRR
ncbi:hypothetical protein [Vibrio phage vB_VpaP_SJSY21]|nr:hypothetical protein [Vibrio phage vB_VpaP_SJSY21]